MEPGYNPIVQAIKDKHAGLMTRMKWRLFSGMQKTPSDRKRSGKRVSDSNGMIKIKRWIHPLLLKMAQSSLPYKIVVEKECQPLDHKPIIFSVNHTCASDAPAFFSSVDIHSYILTGKQRLNFLDWIFFSLNGTIWVDRKEKESMQDTKTAIEEYLMNGQSILWFPEGTWNLTDNLPVMPLKWGIIKVAKKCNAQIIPVNLWYDRENRFIHTRFGKAIDCEKIDSAKTGIDYLRNCMATLWWENLSMQDMISRSEVSKKTLQKPYYDSMVEYPPLDVKYEQSVIYKPRGIYDYKDVFDPLRNLVPRKENLFLLRYLYAFHQDYC